MARANLQDLAERIAALQRSEHPGRRVADLTGKAAWEDLVLGGKLAGAVVELFEAEEGMGAWTLALFMARQALGAGKILVVVDKDRCFYPPAAQRFLGDLQRTIVIRPRRESPQAVLTAMTQSLRCASVGAALGKLERLSTTDCRRLQVAAESGGGIGLVLRPISALNTPSFAAMRLVVTPLSPFVLASGGRKPPESASLQKMSSLHACSLGGLTPPARHQKKRHRQRLRKIRVEIARLHGGPAGQTWTLEIDDEKGDVRLSAPVAPATSLAAPARAAE